MEKFTVDLDKVLDEFEFNEEQAVRHALQHFKREDLPATKYQKPHFKPINISDADFGPNIETTMSYPNYQHDCESESDDEIAATDSSPIKNHIGENLENPVVHNDLESIVVNSCDGNSINSNHCNDSVEKKLVSLNFHDSNKEIISTLSATKEPISQKENTLEYHCSNDTVANKTEIIKKENENENEIKNLQDCNLMKIENNGTEEFGDEAKEPSLKSQDALKSVVETDSCDSSITNEKMGDNILKLPEQCDNNQMEASIKDSSVENENIALINNDEMIVKEDETKQNRDECEIKSKSTEFIVSNKLNEIINNNKQNAEPTLESISTQSNSGSVAPEKECFNVETPDDENVEEVAPIQFETQSDITDEELQKYLEELEKEEAEEKKKEIQCKPVRPQSLNLGDAATPGRVGSPGQTPLPRTLGEGEGEGIGMAEQNLRNENVEDLNKELGEINMSEAEDSERPMETSGGSESGEPPLTIGERRLGKVSPFWMPDHLASNCMECESKFTVIKRRHHCRACGRILCSKCCGMKASLEYLQNQEQRVCETCFRTLAKVLMYELQKEAEMESSPRRRPNPNNPMEYCSTVPPPLQISSSGSQSPPSVMVPVGVLKREGMPKAKETPKQVMFSDGIRPGGDLTELDGSEEPRNVFRKPGRSSKKSGTPPGNLSPSIMLPPIDPVSQSFVVDKSLPPIYQCNKGETSYEENWPLSKIMEKLKDPDTPPLQFAINRNLIACIKIVKLDCCMKETCWVICSKGMGNVGQDEILILLTLDGENDDRLPKEILLQFQYIYQEASRGNTVNELGYWCVKESSFLESKQHGGFLFIRPTFQCLNHIELPPPPYLVGILIHRSEIPWARVFPFRLMLRLGAEFRYYPCPLVSVRFREPVYYEIGHTIINLLADFRNLSYTIPNVRGLKILMEANQTSILIPRNRYDQVVRALNNSNDPVLALAGSFSPEADAYLVCMQSKGNEVTYSTHAININDKPRKVTGASFVVLNGALKTTSGVTAKSSIVEDGLMVQVPSETMTTLRNKLRNMEDWSVSCGPIEGRNTEEIVKIIWCEDDKNFNVGVKSVIDNMPLDGVPSIRVHSGKDYMGCSKFIRWTQVFIIKCEDGATSAKIGDPPEVNKLSESIARATCLALIKLLELLAASGLTVLAVRATMDRENVGYEAGSNGEKLAPIYMNSLDNELIPVLHKAASINDSVAVLELMFHLMDK